MIKVIEQDIFKALKTKQIQVFAHGANCWSTMGAGIAYHVNQNLPMLYKADKDYHLEPEKRLGRCSSSPLGNGAHGYNLYTQFYPGPHAKLEMIRSSLTLMLEEIAEQMVPEQEIVVGLPAIGCGIGGLNFFDVVTVINEVSELLALDYPTKTVSVVVFLFPDAFPEERKALSEAGIIEEVKSL